MSKGLSRIFVLKLLSTLILTIYIIQTSSVKIKTTLEIIKYHGYRAECHKAITTDGYILELHRIFRKKWGKKSIRNYPVLIPNGFMGDSASFVLGGPQKSLPMQLADDGYDVWLANNRGNKYSRKHLWLKVEENPFWNFTLHEIGVFDLPAMIDVILKKTKKKKLHYIGYSMSTTTFFILASQKLDYREKIRSHISLAPVSNIVHTTSSLKSSAEYAKRFNSIFQKVTHGEVTHTTILSSLFLKLICKEHFIRKTVCLKLAIYAACGTDKEYFDSALLPKIIEHFPAGSSSKLIAHYAQFITSERFGQYDYGPQKNLKAYKSIEAPLYDLKLVNVPTILFYSENDLLANPTDVMRLKDQLPKVMGVIKVDCEYFNHLDFIWSKRVTELVNDPVKETLSKTDEKKWRYTAKPDKIKSKP